MIKGIYIESQPDMESYSEVGIMSQLDPLWKSKEGDTEIVGSSFSMKRHVFLSKNLYITVFIFDKNSTGGLASIFKIYKTIQKVEPSFLKVFMYGDSTVVAAYPRYSSSREDEIYKNMISELTRVTAFFVTSFGGKDEMVESMLSGYISLCISTPKTRSKNDI